MRSLAIAFMACTLVGIGWHAAKIDSRRTARAMVPTSVALDGIHDVEQHSIGKIKELEKTCLDAIDRVRKGQR